MASFYSGTVSCRATAISPVPVATIRALALARGCRWAWAEGGIGLGPDRKPDEADYPEQHLAHGTLRVNRGKPELQGCALVAFLNNVGVSYFHILPKVVFRPDGTIDFSKEDWLKGGFVLSVLKDDDAYIPYLPNKLKRSFGYFSVFRMDAQVLEGPS